MMSERQTLRHRLFFALMPPIELARAIVADMERFADGARMMRPERLHITLDLLDDFVDFPAEVVAKLLAAGAAVRAAPVDVVLETVSGGSQTFALRPRLKIAGLEALRGAIVAARTQAGLAGREDYAFSPHMTLSYRKAMPFSATVAPVGWRAGDFVLIHSLLGVGRHEEIGRWPLRPAAEPQLSLSL